MFATKTALCFAAALALASFAGCANKECCKTDDQKTAMAGPKSEPAKATPKNMTVINTMCPIGGDDFESKTDHAASLTRSYKGENIGFCCENCVRKFDKMADDKKDGVLAAAKANKTVN